MEIIRRRSRQSALSIEPTGITLLDLALGGGVPWGKPINIVGDRSAGKTILACEILASSKVKYKDKLHHEYDDAENGFSIPTEVMYNMHVRTPDDYRSITVEDLEANINKRVSELEGDEKLIYICDTVEGLQSDEELAHIEDTRKKREKGEKASGTYGTAKARHFNQLLRSSNLADPRVMTIFVSQTRDKLGVTFGSVKTRHCERALEYWSNIIVYLRVAKETTKTIDKKEYSIGAVIEASVKKNKVIGSKFKPLLITRDNIGIDNVDTNICFLFDLIDGHFKIKEQINVEFGGEQFKSRAKLISFIEENDLEFLLENEVTKKWNRIVDKLSPKDRKKRY